MTISKSRLLFFTCILLVFCLSFTPYYSVGYFLLIIAIASRLDFLKILPSLFGRIVVSSLVLLATIMLVGLAGWLLKAPLHPIYVTLVLGGLLVFLTKKGDRSNKVLFDRRDLYAGALGLLLPLVLLASYFLPHYTNTALYQILSNGWDHSSHVFIIETAAQKNGYAYAKETGKTPYANESNAYPQAWHLASAHFMNGFGHNLFSPSQPITVLKAYLGVVILWYFLSAYLLSRIALYLFDRLRVNEKVPKTLLVFVLSIATLVIQAITLFGALDLGFANFIGLMTYMLFLAVIVLDDSTKFTPARIILAAVACTAATLCWFLPAPALFMSLLLYVLHLKGRVPIRTFLRHNVYSLVVAAIIAVACAVQILIFVLFSGVSGGEQINAVGGAYKNSVLLITLLLVVSGIVLSKKITTSQFKGMIILVAPLASLLGLVFLYQTLLSGDPSYYYYKLLYLLTLYAGIFFIPVVALGSQKLYQILKRSVLLASLATFAFVGLLIISTQQPLDSLESIPQRNSRVAYTTAQVMASYLENEDPSKTKFVALTFRGNSKGPKKNDVFNGDLVSRVSHLPPTCAFYIMNNTGSKSYSARIKRLSQCADETSNTIIVVTNNPTFSKVQALNKPNIQIVNVK